MKKVLLTMVLAVMYLTSWSQVYYGLFEEGLHKDTNGVRLAAIENDLGKKPALCMFFIKRGEKPDISKYCNALLSKGVTPIISLEPAAATNNTENPYTLTAIKDGTHDAYWRWVAGEIKQMNGTVFLRFAHEMNGNWYEWAGDNNGSNTTAAANYILAWRHVYDVIKNQEGATNVLWNWCVNGNSVPNYSWNEHMDYYPGTDYVDWIGFDSYDKPYNDSTYNYKSVQQTFGPVYNILVNAIPDKPILIGEFASENTGHTSDPHKQDFFDSGDDLYNLYPRVHAWSYFNVAKSNSERWNDYRINNPSSLQPIFKQYWVDNVNVKSGNAGIENIHKYKAIPTAGTLKVEAETFFDHFGMKTEVCTEGGLDMGYASTGDWIEYLIDVPASGNYTCNLRVASNGTTGVVEIRNEAGTTLATYAQTTSTGGWQTFESHAVSIALVAGKQKLRLHYTGGGLNLNWFELSKAPNTLPTVSFTSPANGTTFANGASVQITATAADADGTITKVEFYDNGATTAFHTENLAPYDFPYTAFSAGSHIITAKAYDNDGGTKTATVTITVAAANVAPTATITAPADGTSVVSGTAINLTANASDTDGTIASVSFYDGATLLGTDTTSPFSFSWTNASVGTHSVTAKATDNDGAVSAASAAVSITVTPANTAPTVSFSSPDEGATFLTGASVRITALATDADALPDSVVKVEFYDNGSATPFKTESLKPYDFTWATFSAGTHVITAKATDTKGATSTIVSRTITVNTAPTVSFTSPTAGSTFEFGASVQITASAADANGTISKVEFFDGGSATPFKTESLAPYDFPWTTFSVGAHTITAKATDDGGATATATRSITIVNTPPTVSMTAPAGGSTFVSGTAITLSVNAADTAPGTVSSVSFYDGATLIGTDATSPYSFSWTGASVGTHSITAKATDNGGAVTTSATVSITVNADPLTQSYFHIVNKYTADYLRPKDGLATSLIVQDAEATTPTLSSFQWEFRAAPTAGYYYIINKYTGNALRPTDGVTTDNATLSQVALTTTNESYASLQWAVEASGEAGYYWIRNKNSNLYIRPDGGSLSDLTNIVQNTLNTSYSSFKWSFVDQGAKTIAARKDQDALFRLRQPATENTGSIAVILYPNPANDEVSLSGSDLEKYTAARIIDLNGKVVALQKLSGKSKEIISVRHLAEGMYIIHLEGNKALSLKFYKSN